METRATIETYLRERPGASTQMIARGLAIDPSTADYHLRRMRKEGAVLLQRSGREVTWCLAASGLCPVLRAALPAFRRAEVAAVARTLTEHPTTTTRLARESLVTVGRTKWAMDVLLEAGLAVKSPTGRVCLAPGASTCVARAMEGSPCALWGECAPSRARK